MTEPNSIGDAILAHARATGSTPAVCVDHLLHGARREHLRRCICILLTERPKDMNLEHVAGQLCGDVRVIMGKLLREALATGEQP
jgi:hypothetical protein